MMHCLGTVSLAAHENADHDHSEGTPVALILNSSGFVVFIQCENSQGREIGWNGDEIHPGVTRYIQAERIQGNGGTCNCHIYAADYSPSEGTSGYVIGASITSHEIGP